MGFFHKEYYNNKPEEKKVEEETTGRHDMYESGDIRKIGDKKEKKPQLTLGSQESITDSDERKRKLDEIEDSFRR